MSRKRSSFNILKDYSISLTPNQPSFIIITRKRRIKVQCFCSKCNRNLVDLRTKKAHDKKLALVTHSAVIPPEETHYSAIIPPEETHYSAVILPEETHYSAVILPKEIPISQVLIELTITGLKTGYR